jgi:hypothetical protein
MPDFYELPRVSLDVDRILPGGDQTGWPFGPSEWMDWDDPADTFSVSSELIEAEIMGQV